MGEHTYNTDHGVFRIKKENVPACIGALVKHAIDPDPADEYASALSDPKEVEALRATPPTISEAFGLFGLECAEVDDGNVDAGDIIDVFLTEGSFPGVEYTLTKVIAPFVAPGSFLVFAYGGASGCWSVEYSLDPETEKTFGNVGDVVVVRHDDLLLILRTLKNAGLSLIHEEMSRKYGIANAAE